jgi:hypothetical protein
MPIQNRVLHTYNQVYYVECSKKELTLSPIAIRPKFRSGSVAWEDTTVGTTFKVREVSFSEKDQEVRMPKKIEITTPDGTKVTLTKLDLKTYDEKIKQCVTDQLSFKTEEQLRDYFLTKDFGWEFEKIE